MAAEVLDEHQHKIAEWTLVPSRGGVFEVTVNGELVFSKKALGRHAEDGEIRKLIKAQIPATEEDVDG